MFGISILPDDLSAEALMETSGGDEAGLPPIDDPSLIGVGRTVDPDPDLQKEIDDMAALRDHSLRTESGQGRDRIHHARGYGSRRGLRGAIRQTKAPSQMLKASW
mmetsp:Transcript_9712/g.29042  ORF Transcript_9712/g.29042 Transcript_9712/m.29042 type:complete len:105 (-) Transcript_9712:482-796(-)